MFAERKAGWAELRVSTTPYLWYRRVRETSPKCKTHTDLISISRVSLTMAESRVIRLSYSTISSSNAFVKDRSFTLESGLASQYLLNSLINIKNPFFPSQEFYSYSRKNPPLESLDLFQLDVNESSLDVDVFSEGNECNQHVTLVLTDNYLLR